MRHREAAGIGALVHKLPAPTGRDRPPPADGDVAGLRRARMHAGNSHSHRMGRASIIRRREWGSSQAHRVFWQGLRQEFA